MTKAQMRRYIVRAIEDAIILACMCICIAGVCAGFSLLFRVFGVA